MLLGSYAVLHVLANYLKKTPSVSRTRNSSGDEIANVNFLYDDIVHALKMQWTLA